MTAEPTASDGVATSGARAMCWRCRRPESVCYCAVVRPVKTRTRVVILQHPRERDVPINTARIAALGLPSSELHVGVAFDERAPLHASLAREGAPPILLFPGAGARDLAAEPPGGPVTLVVLDGTWWQAEKLYKSNAFLRALPHYSLNPQSESRYRIRKEPAAHCLSTIEALVGALSVLEGADMSGLLAPFDEMVERQLHFVRTAARPRRRHASPRYESQPIAPLLRQRPDDVLVAYGEANAWPYGTPGAPQPEVVHWVAQRFTTGERFEAYIRPEGPFAPSFFKHARLSPELVAGAETFASFAQRWQRFVRASDLLAGWGFYASRLLRARGVVMPSALDLREPAIRLLGRRAGELDDYLTALSLVRDPAWAEGRAGYRLAGIDALAKHLAQAYRPRRSHTAAPESG